MCGLAHGLAHWWMARYVCTCGHMDQYLISYCILRGEELTLVMSSNLTKLHLGLKIILLFLGLYHDSGVYVYTYLHKYYYYTHVPLPPCLVYFPWQRISERKYPPPQLQQPPLYMCKNTGGALSMATWKWGQHFNSSTDSWITTMHRTGCCIKNSSDLLRFSDCHWLIMPAHSWVFHVLLNRGSYSQFPEGCIIGFKQYLGTDWR